MLTASREPTTIMMIRTCSRCGQEFGRTGGAHVCDRCRKPRPVAQDYAGRPLGPREKQIARLVCQAKANKEIAYELHLSEGTIKVYLSLIFKKMRVQNRTELALRWIATQQDAA